MPGRLLTSVRADENPQRRVPCTPSSVASRSVSVRAAVWPRAHAQRQKARPGRSVHSVTTAAYDRGRAQNNGRGTSEDLGGRARLTRCQDKWGSASSYGTGGRAVMPCGLGCASCRLCQGSAVSAGTCAGALHGAGGSSCPGSGRARTDLCRDTAGARSPRTKTSVDGMHRPPARSFFRGHGEKGLTLPSWACSGAGSKTVQGPLALLWPFAGFTRASWLRGGG